MKLIARSHEARYAAAERLKANRFGTRRAGPRGQVLVLFAGAAVGLFTLMALVIDLSWYWTNTLKVQRAADAAALAGVVWLPANFATGRTVAWTEATKNGYTNPVGGCVTGSVCVTPTQDTTDPRQLNVQVTAPVNTFFMRIVGINSITASRTARAIFLQPVPMGSPLNYYGISCMIPVNPSATWPTPACATPGNSNGPSGIVDAAGGTQLASQGFWGVLFERGGDSRNGDAYSPLQVSNGGAWVSNSSPTNSQGNFDPAGYNYSVEVPAAGGAVYLFDPQFCEVGTGGNGQAGVGDQYTTAAPGASSPGTVTTYYNLFNTNGTAFTVSDDTLVQQQVYSDPVQTDQSRVSPGGPYVWGTPAARAGARNCAGDAGHNRWVTLASGLPAGTYRLQATTTNVDTGQPSGGTIPLASQPSNSTGAANRFGIEVTGPAAGSATPRVYGGGRMGAYNNLPAGTQLFYLAQIDQLSGAGKTAIISLYDPGDVSGGAWLRILSPDGNLYNRATFNYTSISKATGLAGPSGTNQTCIQTNTGNHSNTPPAGCPNASGGGSLYDAYWLTISVAIPSGYGTVVPASGGSIGLTPPGEPGAGWWKIEYTVNGGNDTTSWTVNIRGNPVHLVIN